MRLLALAALLAGAQVAYAGPAAQDPSHKAISVELRKAIIEEFRADAASPR